METESPPTPKQEKGRTRLLVLSAVALLVLVIVVPPFVNINRFRHSIVQSISAGLDRPVYASAVELTLFPRPAFVLHNFTVAEWPAYGAEPVITAETVTANLRASTLWHRRVEIASLHFDAPSVNLARDSSGQWNVESLIGNSPVLRSSAASSSASPAPFPYVEATDARINFKRGAEKLPFSLEGADLAFWKGPGNEWHVRIKAHPVRTDLPGADAGQILGEASVKTSGTLMDAPIRASLEWRRGQLGEVSRLLDGEDSGWRGTVDWTVNVQGTLAKALATTEIRVEEFRRAEFIPPSEIDLAVHCQGQYVHTDRRLDSIDCEAPLGGGRLQVTSNVRGSSSIGDASNSVHFQRVRSAIAPSVQVTLRNVSAGFFLQLLRHIHPGVAADASVSGEVNGKADCEWRGLDTLNACWGELRSTPLTLSLPHVEHRLHLTPLLISSLAAKPDSVNVSGSKRPASRAKKDHGGISVTSAAGVWDLAPSRVSLGGAAPATVVGTLTPSGLALNFDGPANLRDLRQLTQALNSPVLSRGIRSIRGSAQMALVFRSNWLPQPNPSALMETPPGNQTNVAIQPVPWFAPSQWSGTVQIRNATLHLASFPGTFHIGAAQVHLSSTSVEWTGLTGTYDHLPFDGSVGWQIPCPTAQSPCARSFLLHTSRLNADRLATVLRRFSSESGLLEELNPWAAGVPELPEISGTFKADVLSAGRLSLKKASLQLQIEGHHAELLAISGNLFGGTLSGIQDNSSRGASTGVAAVQSGQGTSRSPGDTRESGIGSAQWGDGTPIYTLRAKLGNIRPDLVAAIWHEKWGHGTATAEIRLHTRGWSAAELTQNASGSFSMEWKNGTLSSPAPVSTANSTSSNANAVMRFRRLDAVGTIHSQTLAIDSGRVLLLSPYPDHLATAFAPQALSGTATFSRILDLRLRPSGISISGPLDRPVVNRRSLPTQPEH